jgi:hypothetical protein
MKWLKIRHGKVNERLRVRKGGSMPPKTGKRHLVTSAEGDASWKSWSTTGLLLGACLVAAAMLVKLFAERQSWLVCAVLVAAGRRRQTNYDVIFCATAGVQGLVYAQRTSAVRLAGSCFVNVSGVGHLHLAALRCTTHRLLSKFLDHDAGL